MSFEINMIVSWAERKVKLRDGMEVSAVVQMFDPSGSPRIARYLLFSAVVLRDEARRGPFLRASGSCLPSVTLRRYCLWTRKWSSPNTKICQRLWTL